MGEPEPQLSLTASELAALVENGIAKRDAKVREAEIARARQLDSTPPPAPPLAPPSGALIAELRAALTRCGNVADATKEIVQRAGRDQLGRAADPDLAALVEGWSVFQAALFGRWGLVKGLIERHAVLMGIVPRISEVDNDRTEPTSQLAGKSTRRRSASVPAALSTTTRGHQVG